jgi:transcriptional regulator GlxA family with amidase domain
MDALSCAFDTIPAHPYDALMKNIGMLLFDQVEELDFVGPLEVFGLLQRMYPDTVKVFTVESEGRPIRCAFQLQVIPEHSFANCPSIDILVVPGGRGARLAMNDDRLLEFVRSRAAQAELITSVCTGALLLAKVGLLDGKRATTHWAALQELKQFPGVTVEHQRYVHDGQVITAGGISAGIDMAFYVVERLCGRAVRDEVAHRMEYRLMG